MPKPQKARPQLHEVPRPAETMYMTLLETPGKSMFLK